MQFEVSAIGTFTYKYANQISNAYHSSKIVGFTYANPSVTQNLLGGFASFSQGVLSGYTNTDTPSFDPNINSIGNPFMNATLGNFGQKLGKEFSQYSNAEGSTSNEN